MTRLTEIKQGFSNLLHLSKQERMLEMAALLTEYFEEDDIKPIIVGGLSVEIYTRWNYTTHDIHLISDGHDQFDLLLTKELGFKKEGRSWYHEKLELSIEIPANFLEGNKDKVIQVELASGRSIYVIGIEDIIIHRLESALVSQPENPDWTDDYEWAERMFKIHKSDIDIMDLNYLMKAANEAQVDQIIHNWL